MARSAKELLHGHTFGDDLVSALEAWEAEIRAEEQSFRLELLETERKMIRAEERTKVFKLLAEYDALRTAYDPSVSGVSAWEFVFNSSQSAEESQRGTPGNN